MPLPIVEPLYKYQVDGGSKSIGTTAEVTYVRVPKRGRITQVGVISTGALTGTLVVAVAINGVSAGASLSISQLTPVAGTLYGVTANLTDPCDVNEDDVISFTPSGGTGAAVTGFFFAVIKS